MIEVLTGLQVHRRDRFSCSRTTGAHTFVFGFEESYGYLSGTDVRDKDGVNACMLIAEAAAWYKKQYGKTLATTRSMGLYEKYGYYGDKVTSFVAARQGRPRQRSAASCSACATSRPPTSAGTP